MRFARVWLKKLKTHNPLTKNLSATTQLHFHSLSPATGAPFDLQIFAYDQNICSRPRVSAESIVQWSAYDYTSTVTLVSALQHIVSVT